MRKTATTVAVSLILGVGLQPVRAALYAVDQDAPTHANGFFAAWYQDTHGRALDLCLSKAQSSRAPGNYMCTLLPSPGVFDDTQPISFPGNFPDEAFWFTGEASVTDAASGIDLLFVSALEAAFNGELPAENDQVSFARIRIRVTVPTAGTYTVTHPYGVDVFQVDTPGTRAINMTRDIGIGAPGDFRGALAGDVGPFLRSVNGPYQESNPESGLVESFVGDPNLTEEVTGSPFGTNFVRIEGPNGLRVETRLFSVSGKLSSVQLPTPLQVARSTFSRGENGAGQAQQDVFVLAPPPGASASFTDAGGTPTAMQGTVLGAWYGQSGRDPGGAGSVSITADNFAGVPGSLPTSKSSALVDVVRISRAEYSLTSSTLTVEAESSDRTGQPGLEVDGVGALVGGRLQQVVTPIPPARVTVVSASGGRDTEDVRILP
ncbi:hypothetical protein PSH28_08535 [Pseudomonas resinovorans]|uniref:hypothetical protein n=1 Tax=Metapseudomonas resinovorans TaxID=53412 RepID=UPI00237F0979|nr:hypothetical protein [Pseudomonas resinovorans]MDE3736634.1 hypothetical protein [Pseudomonas resinovorans]